MCCRKIEMLQKLGGGKRAWCLIAAAEFLLLAISVAVYYGCYAVSSGDMLAMRRFLFRTVMLFFLVNGLLLFYFCKDRFCISVELKKHFLLLLLLILISSIPLTVNYLFTEAHDLRFHLMRIEGIAEGIRSYMFPVRIQQDWLSGHGYAASVFYGDVFLYLPAVLYICGESIQTAYRFYVLFVNGATVFAAYFCFSKMSNHKIGLVATVLYTLNIYRLVCLYTRAAVGEYTAMVFLPLVLYGLWSAYTLPEESKEQERSWLTITAGCTGIFLSHMITTEIAAFFIIITCILLWKRTLRKKIFLVLIKAAAATVLLNLWLLVPFLDYMACGTYVITSPYAYQAERIEERGVSLLHFFSNTAVEMPLTVGGALLLVLLGWIFLNIRMGRAAGHPQFCSCRKEYFAVFLCFLSLFMPTNLFPYTWLADRIQVLQMFVRSIQFPWRMFAAAGIMLSYLFCLILHKEEIERKKKAVFAGILLVLSIWQGISYMGVCLNHFSAYYVYQEEDLSTFSVGGGEYLPLKIQEDSEIQENAGIQESFVLQEYMKPYLDQLTFDGDAIDVEAWRREKGKVIVSLTNKTGKTQQVEVPLLLYKGYHAIADTGEELAIYPGESYRIAVSVPADFSGSFRVAFREPWYWRVCEGISLVTLLGIVFSDSLFLIIIFIFI